MAIVSVKRLRGKRNSSSDLKSMRAQQGWQVVTDDVTTSEIQVKRAPGIPRVGDPHPEDMRLTVVNIETGDPDDSGYVWNDVKAKYEALTNGGTEDAPISPLDLPAEISGGGRKVSEMIDRDVNQTVIANTVGEPFDPPITETFTDQEITIVKNFATYDPVEMQKYYNNTNADNFLGFPPGTVLIDDIRFKRVVTPTLIYYQVTFIVLVRLPVFEGDAPETAWERRIKNEGYYYKNAAGDIVRAVDKDDKPVVLPVPLKSDGTRVPVTAGNPPVFDGEIFFRVFKTKKTRAFAPLNIL